MAVRFAQEGYKVALVARRLESSKPVEEEIVKAGGQALSVAADTGIPSLQSAASMDCPKNSAPMPTLRAINPP